MAGFGRTPNSDLHLLRFSVYLTANFRVQQMKPEAIVVELRRDSIELCNRGLQTSVTSACGFTNTRHDSLSLHDRADLTFREEVHFPDIRSIIRCEHRPQLGGPLAWHSLSC